jgi:RHS repeat-associated protein
MARLTHSCLRTSRFSLNFFALRRITAIALMLMFTVLLAPLRVQASVLQSFERKVSATGGDVWSWWDAMLGSFARGPSDRGRKGVRPVPALSKDELEARVASLAMNPAEEITLQSRQPLTFTAIPLDAEGNTVHGVRPSWRSSDRQVIFIKKNGEAVAGKPGKAVVIARIRNQQATVRVTVVEGTSEPYGGKKKTDSTRSVVEEAAASSRTASPRESVSRRKRAHAGKLNRAGVMPFIRNPNEDPLPDSETSSIYQPNNLIGAPPGKKKPGALSASSVVSATESGNKNFNFELPVVGMPGRGIDVALSLVYNSLLWNKSVNPSTSQTWMTYDVDSGYPAQGFRLGYGQLEDQGSAGFTLTDANGTRHALVNTSQFNYDSTDGTFIHFTGGSGWGAVTYSDGTIVGYGAAGGGLRSYPTSIEDRNGNYILISYVNGVGPRIYSITDTVGRLIRFYYDSNNELVAITKPGLTSQSDLQVMRFYYETLTLPSGLFGSGINVNKPASARVIRYIYQPVSSEGSTSGSGDIGYRFDYSQYGMIYQMVKFHGMTASTTSTSSTGTVTEGTQAAITTYGYPTTAGALTDVPTFSTRTDDWAGRTNGGSAPQYSFSVSETSTETTSTVTAPDTSVTVSVSIKNSGAWNDGLVKETRVQNSSSVVFSKTVIDWEQNSANGTPRVASIRQTNEAGKTAATVLSYDSTTPYNNVSVMSERDFTTNGTVSSTELRRTETTYLTSSNYLNRRLLHLPSMVKMFPGSSSTPAFRVDYGYDNYGSSHENLTARNDIIMHDPSFDPYQETQETCDWVCNQYDHWGIECIDWRLVCTYYNPYNPDTDYRGNVTSVTTYPDATTTSGAITRATTYDIAGNVMTEEVDCCQSQSYTYSSTNSDYAYPVSIKKGNPSGLHLTTAFTYDMNTGLVATMTDANNRTTNFSYNSDTLSTDHIDFPDGGQLSYDYFNALAADSAGRYHFSIVTSTKLDSTRYLDSKSYFDGRGALRQTYDSFTSSDGWAVSDIEYDAMGRAYRSSYPYYCTSNYGTCSINPSGVWSTRTFDTLGRITQVTSPRGDDANPSLTRTAQTTYEGDVTTSTDHAGKQRRQIVDALGRMIRLDEPNSSGSLGTVGSPAQSTSFMYDVLDNLVKITQGSQERFFKYDSLSRLIRERQVEQTTNSAYNLSDSLTGNSSWTRKLEYNSQGLVTNAYDARGVQTSFSYDGLNRVTLIDYSDSTPDARYYYDSQTLPSGAPSYTHGDANGRLIAMTYGSSSSIAGTYFGYDNMGRINVQKQVTGANTYSLSYTYNLAGLLASETYPTNRVLTHSYDNAGRLSQISDGTTTFASNFTYAASGGLLSETWGNGAVHSIAYNNALQVSQVKLKQSSSGSELQRYDYLYGQVTQSNGSVDKSKNNGQLGRVDGVINGSSTKEWEQRFSYDELGRLSRAAEFQQGTGSTPSWQQEFTYDRYGNRFQSGSNNFGVAFTPVVSGDITASTNRFITSGSTPVTYDNAGNITQDAKFRFMNYTYDANWRQVSVTATNSDLSQTSVYDCAGQRVQTTSNGVTRTMVYDIFGQLVADYNGTTMERENIYRDGQVLAVYEAASTCYMTMADFVTSFYQGALNRNPNSTELAEWTGKLSQAQAQGNGRLIKVAQDLGAAVFTSTEYTNLNTSNADYVTDLYNAFLQRAPDSGGFNYWTNALNTGSTRTHVRNGFAYSLEFQGNVMRLCATINSGTSTSANLKYMFTDAQGSTRAVMNNSGSGTSTILARHDYLPFGEEIWAGVGLRTTTQKYAMTDKVRQRFALTERDEASGLDHTWFRKYDSFAGRFTSPDLMAKRAGNPQDLNAYHYTQNDPINAVDPTGLLCFIMTVGSDGEGNFEERCVWFGDWDPFTGFQPRDRVPGDPQGTPPAKKELTEEECNKKIAAIFGGQGAVAATVNEPPGVNIGPGANRNRYDHLAGQGVFHIYTDAQGSNKTTGLYIPKGGNYVSGGEYDNKGDTENYFRYSYSSGPYRGVSISLVHVGGTHGGDEGGQFLGDFKGETNAAGSERIGNIGGLGGDGNGYNHTHVIVRLNGKRIDPRKVFCKKK